MSEAQSIISNIRANTFYLLSSLQTNLATLKSSGNALSKLQTFEGLMVFLLLIFSILLLVFGSKCERLAFSVFFGTFAYAQLQRLSDESEGAIKSLVGMLPASVTDKFPVTAGGSAQVVRVGLSVISAVVIFAFYSITKFAGAVFSTYLIYNYLNTKHPALGPGNTITSAILIISAIVISYILVYWLYGLGIRVVFAVFGGILLLTFLSSFYQIPPNYQSFLQTIQTMGDVKEVLFRIEMVYLAVIVLVSCYLQS